MTPEQIEKAAERYIATFRAKLYEPRRCGTWQAGISRAVALNHAYWMAVELKTFVREKPEKAERWLCFIQGVLWSLDGWTIDAFKDDNRSKD